MRTLFWEDDMKRQIGLWQLVGFAFTALGGTLLHFLYDWLAGAIWIAPFSGVNESTWEHMKLLFWPMLLFAVVQSFFFRDRADFWCIKLRGILLGILLIPILFYTYNGVVGKSPDFINIAIFFLAAGAAFCLETVLFQRDTPCTLPSKAAWAAIFAIGAVFAVLTFATPQIPFFKDPVTGTYGFQKRA